MGSQPPCFSFPRSERTACAALPSSCGVPTGSAVPLALLSHSASLLCTPCKGPTLFLHWGSDSEHFFVSARKDLHFQLHLSSILKAEYLTPGRCQCGLRVLSFSPFLTWLRYLVTREGPYGWEFSVPARLSVLKVAGPLDEWLLA